VVWHGDTVAVSRRSFVEEMEETSGLLRCGAAAAASAAAARSFTHLVELGLYIQVVLIMVAILSERL
jgi:hypothetical protein